MPTIQRIRIHNPRKAAKKRRSYKKVSRAKAQAKKRANPGWEGGVLSVMSNPKKKKSKKRRNYKRNPAVVQTSGRKRRSGRRRNPRRYRRNPQFAGFTAISLLKLGGGALAGGIGTRALTSVVLKDKNVGALGILANLLVAGGLTFLASKMDATVATGVAAGGIANTAQRVWDVYVVKVLSDGTGQQPALPAAAQANPDGTPKLGDVSFSADGLGSYLEASFPRTVYGKEISYSLPASAASPLAASAGW